MIVTTRAEIGALRRQLAKLGGGNGACPECGLRQDVPSLIIAGCYLDAGKTPIAYRVETPCFGFQAGDVIQLASLPVCKTCNRIVAPNGRQVIVSEIHAEAACPTP